MGDSLSGRFSLFGLGGREKGEGRGGGGEVVGWIVSWWESPQGSHGMTGMLVSVMRTGGRAGGLRRGWGQVGRPGRRRRVERVERSFYATWDGA